MTFRIYRELESRQFIMRRWFSSARIIIAQLLLCVMVRSAEPPISATDLPRTAPTPATNALTTFQVRPGVRVELVASEPLIADPIAMCFDEDSRLFVVEMRDYSERRDERLGRITMLEDTDEDGRMDKATIFADELPWPTALIWYGGGLFVGATPDILYLKDTDNDGKADERKVVFTGFGTGVKRLNVQALLNSFTWGFDNRIHGANGGNGGTIITKARDGVPPLDLGSSDFSFDPRTFEIRRENGGGQYGLNFDNAGRKFVCSNSAHIRQVMYDHQSVLRDMQFPLPSPALDIATDGANAPVFRISPEEPWRVIRTKWRVAGLVAGPVEGGGRASGYFTSASGITIYRGTALGADFLGDAFVADVGSNLVHRKKIRPNGVAFKAERADDEKKSEFLASRDVWFRPVAFANAPDGALYIADMYREVIEHPWSIPENMKKLIDLNAGNDRGRIYRVVSTNYTQPKLPKLAKATAAEVVPLLEHPNGWHRETASRLIYERVIKQPFDVDLAERLHKLLQSGSRFGKLHAFSTLLSLSEFSETGLLSLYPNELAEALKSEDAELREAAVRALPRFRDAHTTVDLAKLASDPAARVRYQFAWAVASMQLPNKSALLKTLRTHAKDSWDRAAIYAAASRDASLRSDFPEAFSTPASKTSPAPLVAKPSSPVAGTREDAVKKYSAALALKGDPGKGREIYLERCASCHRLFGQGSPVGPDLESVRTAGRETTLIHIIDPNREVQPRYATVEVDTTDDEPITGVVWNDAANGLTLKQANGVEVFVSRAKIKSTKTTSTSLMPEGLEAGLTEQDVANLLSYLGSN